MFSSLRSKLLKEVLKNEASYLFSTTVMFTSLFFILFVLFMSKEIFIHYSDSKSMLLPKSMLFVKDGISTVSKKLKKSGVLPDEVLLARVKNYENLSVYSDINEQKLLPKNFTLLSFDIHQDEQLSLECKGKSYKVNLLDLKLKQYKNWVFKTEPLKDCPRKSRVTLKTQNSEIELLLKRNHSYAKLVYKSEAQSDKYFYAYLIKLEERLFLNYFAYSKFFVYDEKKFTHETAEHAKMLNSLFRIVFAKKRQKVLLNHEAYSFLTEYKKIPFSIKPISQDFSKSLTVLDELALNITNDRTPFYSNLILANLSSLSKIKYDGTLVFFKNTPPDYSLFEKKTVIQRKDFTTVKNSASFEINLTVYITTLILFILMLALIHSFVSRSYKRYHQKFSILIFFGFTLKIVTLIFTLVVFISVVLSYSLTLLLFNEVNDIFNLYYVDLIRLDFEHRYIVIFILLSLFFAYLNEKNAQNKIANKGKGN